MNIIEMYIINVTTSTTSMMSMSTMTLGAAPRQSHSIAVVIRRN